MYWLAYKDVCNTILYHSRTTRMHRADTQVIASFTSIRISLFLLSPRETYVEYWGGCSKLCRMDVQFSWNLQPKTYIESQPLHVLRSIVVNSGKIMVDGCYRFLSTPWIPLVLPVKVNNLIFIIFSLTIRSRFLES